MSVVERATRNSGYEDEEEEGRGGKAESREDLAEGRGCSREQRLLLMSRVTQPKAA